MEPPTKIVRRETMEGPEEADVNEENGNDILEVTSVGSLLRRSRERVSSLQVDRTGQIVACHGTDATVELFQVCSDKETEERTKKREKTRKKKISKASDKGEEIPADLSASVVQSLQDEIIRLTPFKNQGKVKSVDLSVRRGQLTIVVLLGNNLIHSFVLDLSDKKNEASLNLELSMPGHRSDVRTISFSSDHLAMLSGSAEEVKIWNRPTLQCIRTLRCGYALSSLFAPGDRHIVIGTKQGHIQIFDVAVGSMLEDIEAHEGAVWSLCLLPDKRGFVSASADKTVKFWDFELVSPSEGSSKQLSISHTRTLQLDEDCLSVKVSRDSRLIAVSLLDSTVKVFFMDTLKFFLSLYGHKLPVLSMDISSDSTLIVTASADRNVKIWGLDFGDCHKSMFAHDDSIMCVQFVPKTHMFFTCSKDGKIKQWDADIFEKILTLEGHHGAVWSLAVSENGKFVMSAGHDRSLRVWVRSQELLVLEDEQETEREAESEKVLATGRERAIALELGKEAVLPGKKTAETERAAERLMEALDIYKDYSIELENHRKSSNSSQLPPAPPLMAALNITSPDRFILETLKKIKSSELEEALLVLPFSYVTAFLYVLHKLLDRGWEVELICRCLFFILRVHHSQIITTQILLPVIDQLREAAHSRVNELRDTLGFNLAGLQHLQQDIEQQNEVQLFLDATNKMKKKRKRHKNRQKMLQRAVLSL